VNRIEGRWAACKTGRYAVVSSYFPHFGEEDCLRGWNGSGTIFFSHCNLRCVFCQNFDISQAVRPGPASRGSPPEEIAAMALELQSLGCHNINFVTPEHVVPQVLEAVLLAAERGLALPIVYNTSAYDSLDSIELLRDVVDIYMPDFKFWSEERSKQYLKAADYPEAARRAIRAMHEQVGPLVLDEDGLARRGVLIRHLVMPGMLEETRSILGWIARELGPDTYVNLMDQYRPAGKVHRDTYPELARRLSPREFEEARSIALELGLRRLDERTPHPRLVRRFAAHL
jgi:putative pyruvate formate lyase activating enzyme